MRLLALTVHCDNHIALQAYRNAGFIDSGRMYFGERSGPQHVLLRTLGSDEPPWHEAPPWASHHVLALSGGALEGAYRAVGLPRG